MRKLVVEGSRPTLDPTWVETVKEDIKKMFRDGRNIETLQYITRTDVEFLLSMGLLVREVGDRFKVLQNCMLYVYIYGGVHIAAQRRLNKEAKLEL